jgi:hypothetical protein
MSADLTPQQIQKSLTLLHALTRSIVDIRKELLTAFFEDETTADPRPITLIDCDFQLDFQQAKGVKYHARLTQKQCDKIQAVANSAKDVNDTLEGMISWLDLQAIQKLIDMADLLLKPQVRKYKKVAAQCQYPFVCCDIPGDGRTGCISRSQCLTYYQGVPDPNCTGAGKGKKPQP